MGNLHHHLSENSGLVYPDTYFSWKILTFSLKEFMFFLHLDWKEECVSEIALSITFYPVQNLHFMSSAGKVAINCKLSKRALSKHVGCYLFSDSEKFKFFEQLFAKCTTAFQKAMFNINDLSMRHVDSVWIVTKKVT